MAQNITIAGASYSDVPSVDIPKTGGGTAAFLDTSDATAGAANLESGFTAYAGGTKITGTRTSVELTLTVTVTSGAIVTVTDGTTTLTGTSTGTAVFSLPNAGTWTISATLNGQTSDTQTVTVVDTYAATLTFFSATITVTVDSGAAVTITNGSSTQTATSTGTAVFTVAQTGTWTVSATLSGQSTSGTVDVVSGTTAYAITLSFISTTLNDNSWDVIKGVSDASQGANYWAIGDRKAVTLNGTVGNFTFSSVATYAFIIGFNHNSSYEGSNRIHFQFGKTALTGGADVCFIDSKYGSNVSATGYFSMNSSNTNVGGWSSSQMRSLLGTSLSSYSGKFIGALPSDLRAVLKSVSKYTDNAGNSSTSAANVTATTDYLFLLAEYEVFGSISYANSNESAKQAQYAYYSAGNSKVKYQHTATTTVARWWLRSPDSSTATACVRVGTSGSVSGGSADNSNGVAPGFCV